MKIEGVEFYERVESITFLLVAVSLRLGTYSYFSFFVLLYLFYLCDGVVSLSVSRSGHVTHEASKVRSTPDVVTYFVCTKDTRPEV